MSVATATGSDEFNFQLKIDNVHIAARASEEKARVSLQLKGEHADDMAGVIHQALEERGFGNKISTRDANARALPANLRQVNIPLTKENAAAARAFLGEHASVEEAGLADLTTAVQQIIGGIKRVRETAAAKQGITTELPASSGGREQQPGSASNADHAIYWSAGALIKARQLTDIQYSGQSATPTATITLRGDFSDNPNYAELLEALKSKYGDDSVEVAQGKETARVTVTSDQPGNPQEGYARIGLFPGLHNVMSALKTQRG